MSQEEHELPPSTPREKVMREELMQALAHVIREHTPQNWGFFLMTFPFTGEQGSMNYVSDAKREQILQLMLEFCYRNIGGKPGVLTNKEVA